MKVLQYKEFRITDEMLASKGTRFGNYIIDRIISTIFAMLFFMALVFIFDLIGYLDGVRWFQNISDIVDYVISALVIIVYYIVFETLLSKTVGKAITKTTVVLEDGGKPSSTDIIIRSFSRLVPFEAFSFLGEDAYGWHDKWSETYVVKDTIFKAHKKAFEEYNELGTNGGDLGGYSIEDIGIKK